MENIVHQGQKDKLQFYICSDRAGMGKLAADLAARQIKQLLESQEEVRIVFAAAPSQDEVLYHLTNDLEIDWSRITGFHMDEYLGLPADSNQWFRKYLQKNITTKINIKDFHFIDGMADPEKEAQRYTNLLGDAPIDVVCLGIGENGHIAFNDPPVADFSDPKMVKVVELDQYSRRQQVNDGCFPTINDVPTHALTLTIPALISAASLFCTVPGSAKEDAIYNVLHQEIDTSCPATILRTHPHTKLILDLEAYGGR